MLSFHITFTGNSYHTSQLPSDASSFLPMSAQSNHVQSRNNTSQTRTLDMASSVPSAIAGYVPSRGPAGFKAVCKVCN